MVPTDGPLDASGHNTVRMMPDRLELDMLGQATAINKPTLPCT